MRVVLAVAVLVATTPAATPAQSAETEGGGAHTRPITISRASRASSPIRLDGRLDEAAWSLATPTTSFTQIDPHEGEPVSQPTEARVLFDDDFLYVGVRLHDSGPITQRLGRRDMPLGDSDWLGVMIDSYHDHRTAFGFDVNPAGVRRDELTTIDVDDNTWDPVWDAATSVDSAGWTAEYRIPFSQLRFSSDRDQTWGIQFERIIGRNREYAVSTFIPKSERGGVPLYGHLTGLRDIRPGKRLEVLPYAVERSSFVDPGTNPFRSDPDHSVSAGLDVLYRMTPSLTMNAAFNPDFGQVEVDPAVVNLGVYETFFEEKRPFFVEGNEIFDFGANGTSGGQIFYSRRIGRAPTLAPPTLASDVPDATTILGAAKVSGKPAGWSVGLLEAVTAREEARYRTPTVPDGRFVVEPLSNYLVARGRREIRGGRTILGGIFTAVNRDLLSPELRDSLHRTALAGGVDFHHELGNRSWAISGDAELSRVAGSTSAITATQQRSNHYFQRPDAEHLEVNADATSLAGYSVNLQLAKQTGEHWRGSVGGALTSPKYEVNDMGFAYRTDRRDLQGNLSYYQNRPGRTWRRWNAGMFGRTEHNYASQPILTFAGLQSGAQTVGYWSVNSQVTRFFRAYDDRLTRGGPIAIRPAWWQYALNVSSDGRKPVTGSLSVNGERQEFGGWNWSIGLHAGVKTSTRWNLTLGPELSRARVTAQYVTTVDDPSYTATYGRRYVFAQLDQTSVALETRLNVTFTPRLSLETYVQPLLSSADYGAPRQLRTTGTYDFDPYIGNAPNRDFNLRSLRGNAVLRWEWREGSTIYFAWQQQRSDDAPVGDFDFARDRHALFGTRPDNIFLVKVNYWINP